jgi:predicted nucleotidyltransferase
MNILADLLSSKVRAEIFRLLFGFDEKEYHVRELERRSGLSVGTVRQELRKLLQWDLVVARRDSNRLYYMANKEHPLYNIICSLVLRTVGLVGILNQKLEHRDISLAFVFGSFAEGRVRAGSDVDLMVIGSPGLRQVTQWLSGVTERTGRDINPYVMTREEFIEKKLSGDHFLREVLSSPKIFICGNEDELEAMG